MFFGLFLWDVLPGISIAIVGPCFRFGHFFLSVRIKLWLL